MPASEELPKLVSKDPPKEVPKVVSKNPPKGSAGELPKIASKDPPKGSAGELPKIASKDPPKAAQSAHRRKSLSDSALPDLGSLSSFAHEGCDSDSDESSLDSDEAPKVIHAKTDQPCVTRASTVQPSAIREKSDQKTDQPSIVAEKPPEATRERKLSFDDEDDGSEVRPLARPQRRSGPAAGRKTLSERACANVHVKVTSLALAGEASKVVSALAGEASVEPIKPDQDWFADFTCSDGVGSPAPRAKSKDRSPETLKKRSETMEKVATLSRKVTQAYEKQKEAAQHRRRRRLKTAPSLMTTMESPKSVATPVAPTLASAFPEGDQDVTPVIIFDWDDTLLPTWYIMEVVKKIDEKEGPVDPASTFYDDLAAHAQTVRKTLCAAREVGRVAIVTLARRPWVATSAAWYLPAADIEKLLEELDIDIYYAREHVIKYQVCVAQLEEAVDVFTIAKRNAMIKCLKKLYGGSERTMHVLCIGDSTAEQEAAKEVLWCCRAETDSLCKTVKLMSDPSVEHLTDELHVLISWFCKMISYESDFDISMETAEDVEQIATTMFAPPPPVI